MLIISSRTYKMSETILNGLCLLLYKTISKKFQSIRQVSDNYCLHDNYYHVLMTGYRVVNKPNGLIEAWFYENSLVLFYYKN